MKMSCLENSILERGIAYKNEGQYDEAVAAFKEVLEKDPNSCDAHHQLGLVYGFTGLFDESLEELQKAVQLAAERVDIRLDLALTYSMLGMYDEATAEFQEVLRLDPNNKRATDSLKFIKEMLG
jgi:tetratricopeptide (TPR) repeat protein